MVSRAADCFTLSEAQVLRAFKKEESLDKLMQFQQPNGPRRIFLYYQPRVDPFAESEEKKEGDEIDLRLPGLEPELFFTDGNKEPLLSKACYFLRMDPTGATLNMDTQADADLLFGEIGTSYAFDQEGFTESEKTDADGAPPPVLSDLEVLIELNVVEVSAKCQFYRDLADNLTRNESAWRRVYEDNAPDRAAVPDYATAIEGDRRLGPFHRLLIVRTLRVDRATNANAYYFFFIYLYPLFFMFICTVYVPWSITLLFSQQ